jgi:hypothetical protein
MALLASSGIINRRGFRSASVAVSTIPQFGLPFQIVVSGSDGADGIYTRTTSAGVYTPEPTGGTYNYLLGNGIFYITSPSNSNYNGDYSGSDWVLANGNDSATIFSENTSTDANNVPTSGWSPSITITSA